MQDDEQQLVVGEEDLEELSEVEDEEEVVEPVIDDPEAEEAEEKSLSEEGEFEEDFNRIKSEYGDDDYAY